MDIKDIKSANNFALYFYENEVYCMKGYECSSFEEFLKHIKEGFCKGVQYSVKAKIGEEFIDYTEFKKLLCNNNLY